MQTKKQDLNGRKFLAKHLLKTMMYVLLICGILLASPNQALADDRTLPNVFVGGQSIGILMQTDGVTIVGFSPITDANGVSVNPATEAGLQTGDFITKINDIVITGDEQLAEVVNEAGKNGTICQINYSRNNKEMETELRPLFCSDTNSYRIGLYVRDNTTGVGTMTFYEPISGIYGALGHEITDIQQDASSGELGSIVRAPIQGIKIGQAGSPGEKIGIFIGESTGNISKNTVYGLFGNLNSIPETLYCDEQMPVAASDQVQTGEAEILTVIEGETIESFTINIVKTMENYKSGGKGMIIEITDQKLIDKTGGIIQGMSGSPIIQNDMLVGAVTHVFVNDPLHGYGCFGEWMLEEAGIID